MTITPEEIEKLRDLDANAVPAPWSREPAGDYIFHVCTVGNGPAVNVWAKGNRPEPRYSVPQNLADFIIAARNILSRLLSAYETEKAAREKAEAWAVEVGKETRVRLAAIEALIASAEARADRMAKALEPFAALGRRYRIPPYEEADSIELPIKCVDLRNAALAEEPKETGNG